jgi:hypothetical protein
MWGGENDGSLESIDSVALSLASNSLVKMEESLVDDRDYNVIIIIGVLRECMVAFGEMYGMQEHASAYLSKHHEVRALFGT